MSKSTPISHLNREQDNSQMVQNIMDEYENQDQMGGQQQMPQAPQHNPSKNQEQFSQDQYDDYEEDFEDYGPVTQQKPLTPTEQIISELKTPLLVVLLVFLTNFGMVNNLIAKNIPKLAESGGELNMLGTIAKALVAGILFYIVKRFLL